MTRCLITDERLAREKLTAGRRFLNDSRLTGFKVIISSRSRTFVVRTGQLYRVLGRWPLISAENAREQALDLLRRLTAGGTIQTGACNAPIPTLREAFDRYVAAKRLKPRSIINYRSVLDSACPELLDLPMGAITTEFYIQKFRSVKSPARANLHASLLASIYNYINAAANLAIPNPGKGVSKLVGLHRLQPKQRLVPDDKQRDWYHAVQALTNRIASDLFVTLALSGARRDELRCLTWKQVNMEERFIHLPDTKNGRAHTFPFGTRLAALLQRRAIGSTPDDLVFPIGEDMVYHNAKKVIRASGVAFSPHDLRRGFATLASRLVCDEFQVKALLNHAPTGVTQKHYIVREVGELRLPMQRIEDYLFSLWQE